MKVIATSFRAFLDEVVGATAVEYALVCMLVAASLVFALTALGSDAATTFGKIDVDGGLTQTP